MSQSQHLGKLPHEQDGHTVMLHSLPYPDIILPPRELNYYIQTASDGIINAPAGTSKNKQKAAEMCTAKPGADCTAKDPTPGRIGTTRAKSFVKLILLAHFLGQIAHVQGQVAH